MVYFTGDFHGNDREFMRRFGGVKFNEGDVIVVLGDAGLNYNGNSRGDKWVKLHVNSLGVDILCIHGNHEMRPCSVPTYHKEEFCGGTVYAEEAFPHLKFAIDGEIYTLGGRRCIAIGGAYSVDKELRLAHGLKWFASEQPDDTIKRRVENVLAAESFSIDCVLSHTCPHKYIPTEAFLSGIDQSRVDRSTEEWLDLIEDRLRYEYWLCGHWHIEKSIDKMRFLYRAVLTSEDM